MIRPRDGKELFNLRHSSLRNSIERIFGVLKKRFPILKKQLEYEYDTQVQLVNGLCCLHNFIRTERDGEDDFDELDEDELEAEKKLCDQSLEAVYTAVSKHTDVTEKEKRQAKSMRDSIAEEMWQQYNKRA